MDREQERDKLTQQCGNCKWWDRENKVKRMDENMSNCNFMITLNLPSSFSKEEMFADEGKNCPCFEEVEEMICN